jgi:hypothetical protein
VDYYTYAYLREDKTPYYIGKGTENRIYSTQKRVKQPKDKSRIIFLKQNLTEEEAFKHERYMIAVFGRKDLGTGILRNMTDGGEGSSNRGTPEERSEISKKGYAKLTPEQRSEREKKFREAVLNMTPEQRSERSRKGQASRTPEERSEISKKGYAKLTPEQRIARSRKGGRIISAMKFQCTVTGFITNAGNLSKYQRVRGIDTSNRVRIDQ